MVAFNHTAPCAVKRAGVAKFIAFMRREAEPQVQRIEIVNAKEVGTADKVLGSKAR
jgi:hypothetical protein